MKNIQHKLSRYCRLVSLPDLDKEASLIYSGLSGHLWLLDRRIGEILSKAENRSDRKVDSCALPEKIQSQLGAAKIIIEAGVDEAKIMNTFDLALTTIRGVVQQFIILADTGPMTSSQLSRRSEQLFDTIAHFLANSPPDHAFFHFWYLDAAQEAPLHALLTTYSRWLEKNASSLPLVTTTLNSSGLLPLKFETYPALRTTQTRYCVFTDELFERQFPTLDLYVSRVAQSMLEAGELGIISYLTFNVHEGNVETYLNEAFHRFMTAGIFYTIITTFNLVPVSRRERLAELYCSGHGHDPNLAVKLRRIMSSRERYRLFTLRGGVNSELEDCIQRKTDSLLPDNSACPYLPNGLVLTLSGEIWTCPILALNEETLLEGNIGRFIPEIEIESGSLDRWRARLSTRMAPCKECPDCLLCKGGCAYDTLGKGNRLYDSVCISIPESIASAVTHNPDAFNHLGVQNREGANHE